MHVWVFALILCANCIKMHMPNGKMAFCLIFAWHKMCKRLSIILVSVASRINSYFDRANSLFFVIVINELASTCQTITKHSNDREQKRSDQHRTKVILMLPSNQNKTAASLRENNKTPQFNFFGISLSALFLYRVF